MRLPSLSANWVTCKVWKVAIYFELFEGTSLLEKPEWFFNRLLIFCFPLGLELLWFWTFSIFLGIFSKKSSFYYNCKMSALLEKICWKHSLNRSSLSFTPLSWLPCSSFYFCLIEFISNFVPLRSLLFTSSHVLRFIFSLFCPFWGTEASLWFLS